MKKALLVLAVIVGVGLVSCTTFEVVNGQVVNLGIIAKPQIPAETAEIASYWQLGPLLYGYNGIINIGYENFAAATAGQQYDIAVKQYYFGMISKVIAYPQGSGVPPAEAEAAPAE